MSLNQLGVTCDGYGILKEVISVYLERAPVLFNGIELGLDEADYTAATEWLTHLEHGSGTIGAKRLEEQCRDIKQLLLMGVFVDDLSPLLEGVKGEMRNVERDLIRFLQFFEESSSSIANR